MRRAVLVLVLGLSMLSGGCTQDSYPGGECGFGSSCPPKRLPTNECPTYEPPNGSWCETDSSLSCVWRNKRCDSADYGSCRGGRWSITASRCAEPSPAPAPYCPAALPIEGTPCTTVEGGACRYKRECGATDEASCKGGVFHVTVGRCACPETTPLTGIACESEGQTCEFSSQCGAVSTSKCSGGEWHTTLADCASCPTSMPAPGDGCGIEGAACSYDDGSCRHDCTCADGLVWSCSTC